MLILLFLIFSAAKAQVEVEVNRDSTVVSGDSSKTETVVIPIKAGKIEVKFTPTPEDTTEKKTEKKKKTVTPTKLWGGLDLGVNGYTNSSQGLTMPLGYEGFDLDIGRSYYLGLNMFERRLPIYRHHVGLISGLGMDINNYRFRSNYNPLGVPDSMGNFVTRDYTKNTLNTLSITVPLLLGFDFGKNNKSGLHVAMGVIGGLRVGSMTKEKFNDGSSRMKYKTHDDFDLNPFRVSAHARVGYKGFSLFASYALTEMFKQNAGRPDLYPFTMGIALGVN